ncbi:Usher syndrome type-1G protein [Homalodisca vitripennis]|nr:Usher syndrome type-1G protein [Homalodisca vitripennis]
MDMIRDFFGTASRSGGDHGPRCAALCGCSLTVSFTACPSPHHAIDIGNRMSKLFRPSTTNTTSGAHGGIVQSRTEVDVILTDFDKDKREAIVSLPRKMLVKGDPEKANYHYGQTALHLAAAKGHLSCVTFLVQFEVSLWALDRDLRTALQVAADSGRRDVVDYLDKAMARQELANRKEVKAKKEKALKDAERRRKKYNERMRKEQDKEEKRLKKVEKEILGGQKVETDTPIPTATVRKPISVETGVPTFTQIVGGTINKKPANAGGVKKILDRKLKNGSHNHPIHVEQKSDSDSGRSVRARADSQIIFVNSYDAQNGGKRGRISDVFDTRGELVRSLSQPEYLNTAAVQDQSSIFDRPGFGSVAFRPRNHLAGTMSGGGGGDKEGVGEGSSIGSAGSLATRNHGELSWESDG